MGLAVPVQGGLFGDLRTKMAEEVSQLDAQLHPIGGVVPLMENYRYRDLVEVILAAKRGLAPGRPVHLFGAGHPFVLPVAILLGCDLFDSSSYIKFARAGRMLTPYGTVDLDDLEYPVCGCPVCDQVPPQNMKRKKKEERIRLIAEHNLYVLSNELDRCRQAILDGTLWELVEQRCRAQPYLAEVLAFLYHPDTAAYLVDPSPVDC